jgi:hypothetical protein
MVVVLWIMAWLLFVCVVSWIIIELIALWTGVPGLVARWIGKPMDVIEAETDVAWDDDEYRRKQ